MRRISATKRLVSGFGVIALGILGALPFHHAPRAKRVAAHQATTADPAVFGEGVALQVPGQLPAGDASLPELEPLPTIDVGEAEPPAEEPKVESLNVRRPALEAVTPPPQLPDQYQPLFRPERNRRSEPGRVLAGKLAVAPTPVPPRRHTIHDGDTLESLALRYLGDSGRAQEILEANRSVLSDPELLPIGVEIVIPPVTTPNSQPVADAGNAPSAEPSNLVPLPALGFHRAR